MDAVLNHMRQLIEQLVTSTILTSVRIMSRFELARAIAAYSLPTVVLIPSGERTEDGPVHLSRTQIFSVRILYITQYYSETESAYDVAQVNNLFAVSDEIRALLYDEKRVDSPGYYYTFDGIQQIDDGVVSEAQSGFYIAREMLAEYRRIELWTGQANDQPSLQRRGLAF